MTFLFAPGYPRKIKDRCVIHSHMCATLNRLTSPPVKGELSLTVRYARRLTLKKLDRAMSYAVHTRLHVFPLGHFSVTRGDSLSPFLCLSIIRTGHRSFVFTHHDL